MVINNQTFLNEVGQSIKRNEYVFLNSGDKTSLLEKLVKVCSDGTLNQGQRALKYIKLINRL